MSEYDAEPPAASVLARSPWPRAPLSGDCSFAHSNALLRAVFEEKVLTEKALLKHLDGKADGKKVAKAEKKAVASKDAMVSEEAGETEDTHPKPEPDAAGKSFFFKGIPGMGTLLFKVTAKVLSPAPHRHTHPHVGGSPVSHWGWCVALCVCAVADGRQAQPRGLGQGIRPQHVQVPALRHRR